MKTQNVRIRDDLKKRLKDCIKKKKTPLGIRKYRSLREAADVAVEQFLLEEKEREEKTTVGVPA